MDNANSTLTATAIRVLSAVPYFTQLDVATLELLAHAAVRREYGSGQLVFAEGAPCAGLYVVESGWLKAIRTSPEGREQVLRVVGPGEFFNEIAILSGAQNQVSIIALEPAQVWVVQRDTMLALLDAEPHVARVVAQNLAQRIVHLLALVQDLSLRSVEARLARLLLQEASNDVVVRRRWLTQAELAARLGTVPDVVNRALRNLVEAELIQVQRHQIQIRNRAGLQQKADS